MYTCVDLWELIEERGLEIVHLPVVEPHHLLAPAKHGPAKHGLKGAEEVEGAEWVALRSLERVGGEDLGAARAGLGEERAAAPGARHVQQRTRIQQAHGPREHLH